MKIMPDTFVYLAFFLYLCTRFWNLPQNGQFET